MIAARIIKSFKGFLTESKYCGSGLKIDLVVVVVLVVVVINLLSNSSPLKRTNIFCPMEKCFGVYENGISSIEIYFIQWKNIFEFMIIEFP